MELEDEDYWNESANSTFDFDLENKNEASFGEELGGNQFESGSSKDESTSVQDADSILANAFSEVTLQQLFDLDEYPDLLSSQDLKGGQPAQQCDNGLGGKLSPKATVARMLQGQSYSLQGYRSLSEKKELIRVADDVGDGNAILEITIFLVNTLKRNLLHQVLIDHPSAILHYSEFLYERKKMTELEEFLELMGKNEELYVKQFEDACRSVPDRALSKLSLLSKGALPNTWSGKCVDSFIKLLEFRNTLTSHKSDEILRSDDVFEILKYALKQESWPSQLDSVYESPTRQFSQQLGMPSKMVTAILLAAFCELQKWNFVESLLITKNWVGGLKLSNVLPEDIIFKELQKYQPPAELYHKLLSLTDEDTKIEIGTTLKMTNIVLDASIKKKDRQPILRLIAKMDPNSQEYLDAQNVLQNAAIKWKN